MKKFILTIDLENDAFQPDALREITSLLDDIATRLEKLSERDISKYQNIKDVNGNTVGQFAIKYVERIRIDEDTTTLR